MIKTAAAKIAAAKVLLVAGVAVAATGGIAVAAATGNLPNPVPQASHAAPSTTDALDLSTGAPAAPDLSAAATTASSDVSKTHPAAAPNPSQFGLCHSWLARPHIRGKADTNPAFTVLVTTAGGTDSVNAYCTNLLAATRSDSATPDTTPSKTTGKPTDLPSAARNHGKPTDLPSAAQNHPAAKTSS